MLTTTYTTTTDSRAINGSSGSWSSQNYVQFTATTQTIIKGIEIPFVSYTPNALVAVTIKVNGSQAFYREFTLSDSLNTKIYYQFDTNVTIQTTDTVQIIAITEAGTNYCSPYGSNNNVTFDAPFMRGSGYFWSCLEVTMTVDYTPIWILDGQNDGYPYPTGTDPTEFTEFAKDADGYPLNWGVWKLDDQNEGYPWPTGFLPAHTGGSIYVFGASDLLPAQLYVFGESGLLPAQIITMK